MNALKNLVPLVILAAFAVGLVLWWRMVSGQRAADVATAAETRNTYAPGGDVSLLEALLLGATPDQTGLPAPGTQPTQSAPLAQPGSSPATLAGVPASQGL